MKKAKLSIDDVLAPEQYQEHLENAYRDTNDPVYAWMAIADLQHWKNPRMPLWVMKYLVSTASNILNLKNQDKAFPINLVNAVGVSQHSISHTDLLIRDYHIFVDVMNIKDNYKNITDCYEIVSDKYCVGVRTVSNVYNKHINAFKKAIEEKSS